MVLPFQQHILKILLKKREKIRKIWRMSRILVDLMSEPRKTNVFFQFYLNFYLGFSLQLD